MGWRHHRGMTEPVTWEDPTFRAEERTVQRRRLLAAVVTIGALVAVAGGSAVGAVAGAHEDRADAASEVVVVR